MILLVHSAFPGVGYPHARLLPFFIYQIPGVYYQRKPDRQVGGFAVCFQPLNLFQSEEGAAGKKREREGETQDNYCHNEIPSHLSQPQAEEIIRGFKNK